MGANKLSGEVAVIAKTSAKASFVTGASLPNDGGFRA